MTEQSIQESKYDYSKASRFWMRMPLFVGLFIVVLLLALLVPRTPSEVSIVGNCMMICFVLLPLLLCLIPVYIVLAVGVFYTHKLNNYTGSKINVLTKATRRAADTTAKYSNIAAKKSIGLRARFAFLNRIIYGDTNGDSYDDLEN